MARECGGQYFRNLGQTESSVAFKSTQLEALCQAYMQDRLDSLEPSFYVVKSKLKNSEVDWCTNAYKHADCDNFKHKYDLPLYDISTLKDKP